METVRISIEPADPGAEPLELDAPDIATALAVADINFARGRAELWRDDRRLARLTKRGGSHSPFWELF